MCLSKIHNLQHYTQDVYLERMVDILDVDGNRTIDFREFVVGLAAFVLSAGRGEGFARAGTRRISETICS